MDLLVEDLFVLPGDEVLGEDLCDEFSQEIGNLAIARLTIIKLFEDSASVSSALRCLLKQVLLAGLPFGRHWAILTQVVVEIELLLIADNSLEHINQAFLNRLAHSTEPK